VEPSCRCIDLRRNTMAALDLLPSPGPLNGFVRVRQRRVLGAWEHARIASSSSIRPGRIDGVLENDPTWHCGPMVRARKGELAKDAICF
jgi:hypothetical protein